MRYVLWVLLIHYLFDHTDRFQVRVFHVIRSTYSTKRILNSNTALITSVHTTDEWTLQFIRIQMNKHWLDDAWFIIHKYTLYSQ